MSAQDYDAWGYILEGRTYESEEGKFKFTGKERDEESFYDYFGARYYDARVGRWGQVEPLLDKYISFSPYQYSMLNPLLIKDINGKDGKVTITGNKVSLEVNLYFAINSETNPQGLTDKQITAIGEFQQKIENSYSGKFEINGKNYDVTTKFNLILEDSYEKAVLTRFENEGSNIIENGGADNELLRKADFGVGVTSGYDLLLASGSALNPDSDTGEHELTHLLGLKGDDLNDSSIENYGRPRHKPNGETFKKIFDINNVNMKSNETQILRGYIK